MKLKINPILQKLAPELPKDDDAALDISIKVNGQWPTYPLTVAQDGDVVDGMNRFTKLKKYNIKPIYHVKKFADIKAKKLFVIQNLIARRHLTIWQKGQLGLELLKLNAPIGGKGRQSEKVAKQIPGLKQRTLEKIMTIDKKASKNLKDKLSKGTMSVDTAYKMVTQKQRNLPKVPLPTGSYDVILCDVPIKFENETIRGAATNHYPTMDVEELVSLVAFEGVATKYKNNPRLHIEKNAIIFFWISPAVLDDGMFIMQCWGFKYKTHFIWEKDRIGTGSWSRNQHEVLLVGIKGTMPTPAKLYPSIIKAYRREHSKKPDIYTMIESMYPKRKYLELFARNKRQGWTSHGNEIKK